MAISFTLQDILIRAVSILTIVFVGLIIGRIIGKVSERIFLEAEIQRLTRINVGLFLSRVLEYTTYVITLLMIAENLGVTKIAIFVLVALIAIILGVNILLNIAFAIPNVYAGFFLPKKYAVNKAFSKGSIKGKIIKKTLVDLHVQTKGKELIVIPYRWFRS